MDITIAEWMTPENAGVMDLLNLLLPHVGDLWENSPVSHKDHPFRRSGGGGVIPVWSTAPTLPDGTPIRKSPEAIARANARNARKYFERKMNANFTDQDYRIDLTYADDFCRMLTRPSGMSTTTFGA